MPAILDPEPTATTSASPNVQTGVCPLCGSPLHEPDACDRCDWVKGYGEHPAARRNPRDVFAAVLSLFWPGLGHYYKGHTKLAIGLAVLGGLCTLWSITFFMFFGFLIFPACWISVAAIAYFAPDLKHQAMRPRAA